MKFQHIELAEAVQRVEQLQKDLDPIYELFFGDNRLEVQTVDGLPRDAMVKFLQLGVLRSQAQKLVTTLIYRVGYLSLPINPWSDTEEQKDTRLQNRKARKELGLSNAQYRKRSQDMIDNLLPVATDFVKDATEKWEEFKTLSAQPKPTHQCAGGNQEKQHCMRPRMPRVISEEEKRMQENLNGLRLGHANPEMIAKLSQRVADEVLANNCGQLEKIFVDNTSDMFIKPRALAKGANEILAGISEWREDRRIELSDNNSPPNDEEVAQGFQIIQQTVMVKRINDDSTKISIVFEFTYDRKVLVAQPQ